MLIELSKEAHKIADAGFKNIQLLFIQILISERMMMYMVPARDEINIVPQLNHTVMTKKSAIGSIKSEKNYLWNF